MRKIFSLLLLFGFSAGYGQVGKTPVQVTDMIKIQQVQNVSLSDDGKTGAFTITSVVPAETANEYRYETQVWMIRPLSGEKALKMTTKENSSQAVISPNGKHIAFTRAIRGKNQVFILNTSGGEARQLTFVPNGAFAPKWSANSKSVLFATSLSYADMQKDSMLNAGKNIPAWPLEKPGLENKDLNAYADAKSDPNGNMLEVRKYLAVNEKDKKANVYTRLNFLTEADLSPVMSFNQFFTINIEDGEEPVPVTSGFYRFNNADFTPDGKSILMSVNMDSAINPDRAVYGEIHLVSRNGRNHQRLLASDELSYSNPQLSPSGKWMTYSTSKPLTVNVSKFYIKPFHAPETEATEIKLDRNVSNIVFSPDEKFLYFTVQQHGGTVLHRYHISGKKLEKLSKEEEGIYSLDLKNNVMLYAKTAVNNPSELFYADPDQKNEKQLTQLNDWVNDRKLSFPEKHSFTNELGMVVDYWVMRPVDFDSTKKYPLLLEIHGGPSAMWGPGESSMWHEFQYFASKGYGVVYSNPRGSGGYGESFLRGNINDWGKGPMRDVLNALDKTVAEGWADTSKLLTTGGSYAGYLVAYIIAHDQRFAAACSQRGVYDLVTFFGEGNAWRLIPSYFGGYPWDPEARAILHRESPINYVQNITTPYIIFHGDNDRRTGFVQSEMMYKSLKVLNRPVEYVRHPNATHEITRSGDVRQRVDQMLRTWEFFERFIH